MVVAPVATHRRRFSACRRLCRVFMSPSVPRSQGVARLEAPGDGARGSGEEVRLWILVHGSASDGNRLLRGYQERARAARRGPYSR